jgi:hypothetical protein
MLTQIAVTRLAIDADWDALRESLGTGRDNFLLTATLESIRNAGAISAVFESAYIDRDFSAAYSSFYSTLFQPYLKYCSRLHFFKSELVGLDQSAGAEAISRTLEANDESYLGYVILRPLAHAPISSAVLSAKHLRGAPNQEVAVRSIFQVHALGATLNVEGAPLTQQDTRIGACAQATIWTAARHFHNRHSTAWYSIPDITEAALKPTDSALTRSLPAGSDYLTCDNMVRAFRAIGQHPVVYAPSVMNGVSDWNRPSPKEIISRYIDSGIPVILGLQATGAAVGHAVVAVGAERRDDLDPALLPNAPTSAEFITHILVNDDQRGSYCRLPQLEADKTDEYPFCLETEVAFIMVPLPSKVYMTAEIAETIARDVVKQVSAAPKSWAEKALGPEDAADWNENPVFYQAALSETLLARTYLTFGWKYKARMMRNGVSDRLKSELLGRQLPRYVWVTEFSMPLESASHDPCHRLVRGHVALDATGSRFWESKLVVDVPGLLFVWSFDSSNPGAGTKLAVNATKGSQPYWPKIRGMVDYARCALPAAE